jgi:hypothetical protein
MLRTGSLFRLRGRKHQHGQRNRHSPKAMHVSTYALIELCLNGCFRASLSNHHHG